MIVDILSADVTERLGNRLWILTQPFQFSVNGQIYSVPRGFVTDGAGMVRAQLVKSGVNIFGGRFYKQVVDKLTKESCYCLASARRRVMELSS